MLMSTDNTDTAEAAASNNPAPIEVANQGDVDEDEFNELEWDAESSASASITSSVLQHSFEHGRRYHHFRNGRYPIPNDDVEQGREALKHAVHLEVLDGALTYADIGDNPQKILDLGTGVGTWAIDMADQYPSAEVVGVDLSPIQSSWVPPNLKFILDDVEDEWAQGNDWDLIHCRHLLPALKKCEKVVQMAFDNLKPGGWWDSQDFGGMIKCDDGTLRKDSALLKFMELCDQAMAKFGMVFRRGSTLGELLTKAGFTRVQCRTVKVPVGTWPKDPILRLVGQYMLTVMSDLMGAFGAKPFRALGMEPAEIEVFLAEARKDMKDTKQHAFLEFKLWRGQKPLTAPAAPEADSPRPAED
ncbi:S-adenosyl-L-methionine-dependent methyltransferase [Paramyrothecium foliicola]|nr:S-adenosyl-L-methionine-dependent methyltransferase [Paramyrothecium foliicola]